MDKHVKLMKKKPVKFFFYVLLQHQLNTWFPCSLLLEHVYSFGLQLMLELKQQNELKFENHFF